MRLIQPAMARACLSNLIARHLQQCLRHLYALLLRNGGADLYAPCTHDLSGSEQSVILNNSQQSERARV